MNRFRSIRWRLQFWYGLFLLLLLAGFGELAYRMERTRQLQQIDYEILRRADSVDKGRRRPTNPPPRRPSANDGEERGGRDERVNGPPREPPSRPKTGERFDGSDGFYYAIWLRNGTPLTLSPTAPSDITRPDAEEPGFRQRGEFREYFTVPAPGDYILVGRSIAPDLAELRHFAWLLAGGGSAVLVVGLLGGWWVVSRTIKPIEDISVAAVKIAGGDLSQRIRVAKGGNEIDQLAGVLNSTFAQLDAAFAQQARFTADAAHELRTPVTVMLAHTQAALETSCSPEENRAAFEACQRAAQRMRRLIESLLELARFDAGREPLQQQKFDLADVAADSIELLEPLAEKRNITLHSQLVNVPCSGDPDRLGQVITNLLSNAIHYNRDGGEVRVVTESNGKNVSVSIIDNGPGIPPEHLPHIFERFYRVDKARTSTAGRTGLGLAICQAIVEAHGGKITVQSEAGKGALFCVQLPLNGSHTVAS